MAKLFGTYKYTQPLTITIEIPIEVTLREVGKHAEGTALHVDTEVEMKPTPEQVKEAFSKALDAFGPIVNYLYTCNKCGEEYRDAKPDCPNCRAWEDAEHE